MTADDDNTINRRSTVAYPLIGTARTVETALAPEPEPERYVRASVYELSLKINRELRKELEQYDVEVQRRGRGRVSIDEIDEEIEEAKERLEKAYRRRARYFLRAVERREQEKTT